MPKVTLLPSNIVEDVEVGANLLEVIRHAHIPIEAACGGVCACSTCHIIVKQGMNHLSPQEDMEADRLDMARGVTLESRLACQVQVEGDCTIFVPPLRDGVKPHDDH